MLKRTICVENPYHISAKNEQILFAQKSMQLEKQVPAEDLGFLILDHPQTTFTQAALQLLSKHNVGVVFSDEKHMPSSMLFHLDTHFTQTEKFGQQIAASLPLKKQLWAQTIKAKIGNQAAVLKKYGTNEYKLLQQLAQDVQSGDPSNREGQAARIYWRSLMGATFERNPQGDWPNAALNYGYAIVRAAVARALCAAGLLPTLGIFHRNRYNSFVLADDIMEPYRPYVDSLAKTQSEPPPDEQNQKLNAQQKTLYLQLLSQDVVIDGQVRPMMNAIQATCFKLAKCFEGSEKKISYPNF